MDVPAGWYPDPASPTSARWWDGTRWTEHTTPLDELLPGQPTLVVPAPASQPTVVVPTAPPVESTFLAPLSPVPDGAGEDGDTPLGTAAGELDDATGDADPDDRPRAASPAAATSTSASTATSAITPHPTPRRGGVPVAVAAYGDSSG